MKFVSRLLLLAGLVMPLPAFCVTVTVPRTRDGILEFLHRITGHQVFSGIHNREPNSRPDLQTEQLHELTGSYPVLWSGDFLFDAQDIHARWAMIYECKRQWDRGSLVQLMFHVAPPTQPEATVWDGGILSHLSDAQWADLLHDGGKLNAEWKRRLDGFADYLAYLQTNGVVVLVRPFHEMNQGKFWWGGRPGPNGTAALYRLTHDYFTKTKGLTNLIWIWDMQDMSHDLAEYNPGRGYWDVFAFDIYANGWERSWYDAILPIAGEAPMIVGECAKLPTPEWLAAQPRWCGFMSWSELTFTHNPPEAIRALYASPRVLTRADQPPR